MTAKESIHTRSEVVVVVHPATPCQVHNQLGRALENYRSWWKKPWAGKEYCNTDWGVGENINLIVAVTKVEPHIVPHVNRNGVVHLRDMVVPERR